MKTSTESTRRLFEAVFNGDQNAIESLLHEGGDPNCTNPSGQTALQTACSLNLLASISTLLKCGADPNKRATIHSPVDGRVEKNIVALHYATSSEAVIALTHAGAEVHATDANGTTPLMRAALHGHLEAVKALLAAGASPSVRQQNQESRTAREMAEAKIKLWRELKNESRRQVYEKLRAVLIDAEQTAR
jgi:cytohesin